MEYRAIRPEETAAAYNVMKIAFLADPQSDWGADAPADAFTRIRAAFDDAGHMQACLVLNDYRAMLDGQFVAAQGVGGVASLPQGRRRGHIRALMELSLREAYARGRVLSLLYPFNFSFYRQFGFELAGARRVCTIPIDQLPKAAQAGTAEQYFPGQDDAEIRAVYNAFIANRNLAMDRDDASMGEPLWKHWLQKDPYKTRTYTYLWRAEDGAAHAYCVLKPQDGAFSVTDCAYDSPEALNGLLCFLRLTGGQVNELHWRMPDGLPVHALVPDPYDVKVSEEARGMARVVNVQAALCALRAPEGEGEYTIAVADDIIPENSGAYRVTFARGKSEVRRTDAQPDLIISVPAFSPLAIGAVSFDEMRYVRRDFTLHKNAETLRRAFARRLIHLEEYF